MSVEENYFVNVDISEDNDNASVVMIFKQRGSSVKLLHSFTGGEAEKFYKILTGEEKIK